MKDMKVVKGPYIKDKGSTNKMMMHLMISLLPIIIFSFYKNGIVPYNNGHANFIEMLFPLIFIFTGAVSTFMVELIYARLVLKKQIDQLKSYMKSTFAIFPGLFLALILPINTPILILVFGAIIATVVGKIMFGGFGNNIFNPALIGCLFAVLIYGPLIASNGGYLNKMEQISTTSATPLSNISTVEGIGDYDTLVKPYGSLLNFGIGTVPGAIGETSAILCLISMIYLLIFKVIKWQIPIIYISTVFGLTCMIGSLNGLSIWYPIFQIMSGGLIFGAVFMATDPVTSPVTPIGQTLYALFLGILTVAIRYLTPYPEGVLTSILTLNMFVFIFDRIGAKSRFNFNKVGPYFVVAWSLIIGLGFYIGNGYKKTDIVDSNFKVISTEKIDDRTIYIVQQKGFSGNIEASIIIENDSLQSIDIINISDDYYPKIKGVKYIDNLLENQTTIEEVDTVSGATITSSAIKNMIINVMKEHGIK